MLSSILAQKGKTVSTDLNNEALKNYYRFHAQVYDITRWSFLFGRKTILRSLKKYINPNSTLVEVGCGTGFNLVRLAQQYPENQIIGIDLSASMLEKAKKQLPKNQNNVQLIHAAFDSNIGLPAVNVMLFSYALTMFNPGWEQAIQDAYQKLPTGAHIAVVDFHASKFPFFERWMGKNHVKMKAHLLPELSKYFINNEVKVNKAYFGLWTYLIYIGQKHN